MAELKIPQKTLQDNFNLQDFKDDFNALNSEIEENKTLTDSEISRLKEIANTWETFKASGGEISGNLLAIQLATKSPSNNYRWAEETHGTGYKIISSNTNPSTGDWREEFIMAYDGFAPKNDKVLGTSENSWNNIFIKGVSKNTNGYTKLPNGLIMQWGKVLLSGGSDGGKWQYVGYPISFPTSTLNVQLTQYSGDDYYNVKVAYYENGGFMLHGVRERDYNWIAIGY